MNRPKITKQTLKELRGKLLSENVRKDKTEASHLKNTSAISSNTKRVIKGESPAKSVENEEEMGL